MRTLVLGALTTVVCSLAACGEVIPLDPDAAVDAGDIDAVPDPCEATALSVDDFFTCLSRGICTIYEDCVGTDTAHIDCDNIPIDIFGNLSPTQAKVVIADASAAGRVQWNPTAAKACFDMLTTRGCAVFKNDVNPLDQCNAVMGAVNNGALCQSDMECATAGARCVQRSGGGTNQCLDYICQAPVATGAGCASASNAFCRRQDRCVYRFVSPTDVSFCATGDAGAQCDDDEDCEQGLFCNGGLGTGTVMGVCTPAKAVGSICKTDEECTGELACVGNFGAITGTCRDVRTAGAVCDTNNLSSACHGHQSCEAPSAMATGICRAAADLGQSCNLMNGVASWCGLFMSCEGGLCREPGAVGDTCTASNFFGGFSTNPNACNLGLFCDRDLTGQPSGTCRAGQANGAACTRESHCDSQYCNNGTSCAVYPTCDF
jgi:hypothetical protein